MDKAPQIDYSFKVHTKIFNIVLKLYKLYLYSPSILFQSIFGMICFLILVPVLREEGQKSMNADDKERKYCLYRFTPALSIFVSNGFT